MVACMLAVACGSSTSPLASVEPGNLLSDADVASAPAGSPVRALYMWFQAAQYGDVGAVISLSAPSTLASLQPGALARAVLTVGSELARPQPVRTLVSGHLATVRALMLSYAAGKHSPSQALPTTFTLTDANGGWRMSNVSVLFLGGAVPTRPAPRHVATTTTPSHVATTTTPSTGATTTTTNRVRARTTSSRHR